MYDNEERLIWEHYLKEADFSHGSFKGDPDVEPMARMTAHDFEEERPDDLDDDMDLLDMSDAELVHAAHQAGVEDTIVFDGEGDIANNDEVIDAIKGDSVGDELSRIPHDKDLDDVKWEEGTENPDLNPDQMDTASVRTVQPVNEYGQAIAAVGRGIAAAAKNPAVRKAAAGALQVGADRAATNVADRLTKKNPEEEEVEEAKLKSASDMAKDTIDMGKKAISTVTLGLQPTPPNPLEDDDVEEEGKNVEETHNPDLNPDQLDTAGVRIVKQEGCSGNPVAGKLVRSKGKRRIVKREGCGCAVVPPGEKEDKPKVTKIKAKMPSNAMDKIKKLMGF